MLILAAAAALLSPAFAGAGPPPEERALIAAANDDRYLEALRLYSALEASGRADGRAAYFAGWTNLRLHRPDRAEPLLEKAVEAGFSPRNRKTAEELLSKARAQLDALPPELDATAPGLTPYADSQEGLCGKILDAQPEFARVGRSIFGRPPALRVYLFATHDAMDRLALADGDRRARRVSTGGYGFVRLSAENLKRPVEDDSVGLALHEMTHAWMATYLRDRYDRAIVIPAYMDEGLANYVGELWKGDQRRDRLKRQRLARIARWRAKDAAPPPDLASLRAYASFHDEARDMLDYDPSELLMERLLGPAGRGAAKIPALLDALARTGGDDAAAWRAVSGKDADAEYAALTRELWAGR